ncbi:GFA family protein [Rhizobium mulingense]|uniref:GFA family protein n=1 Tax=Rhizobium mulingense TaxID=3031128 RepID=UPI002B48036D|nr:GFA family protein [Rhizobium sp. MJ21]MEB3046014.1 GFA family protein [Rhizobium sp. MJ21]
MKRLAQCHCGSLRAKTSGDPLMVSLCHCRDCQRSTGAVAGSGAVFEKAEVTTEGKWKLFERAGADGRKVRFHFCPNCGTSLYWEGDFNPNLRIVAVGASQTRRSPRPWFPSTNDPGMTGCSFRTAWRVRSGDWFRWPLR